MKVANIQLLNYTIYIRLCIPHLVILIPASVGAVPSRSPPTRLMTPTRTPATKAGFNSRTEVARFCIERVGFGLW